MAHKVFWFQGQAPFVVPKCDGQLPETCPQSTRIAAEYNRGYFTLTNVLNPNIFYDDYGVESPLKKALMEVKEGDVLWLALVPPMHKVLDVFAYNETTFTEHSSYDTFGGIGLTLQTGKFKAEDENGECAVSNEEAQGSLVFPAGADAKKQFVLTDVNVVNDTETWLGVGFKVDTLPQGKTLADIVGKLVIGCHALDCDAQTFMM